MLKVFFCFFCFLVWKECLRLVNLVSPISHSLALLNQLDKLRVRARLETLHWSGKSDVLYPITVMATSPSKHLMFSKKLNHVYVEESQKQTLHMYCWRQKGKQEYDNLLNFQRDISKHHRLFSKVAPSCQKMIVIIWHSI